MILKSHILFSLVFFFLVSSSGKSCDDENNLPITSTTPYFDSISDELMLNIVDRLYDDTFRNFSRTSSSNHSLLNSLPRFFMPETQEKLGCLIQETPVDKILDLLPLWRRGNQLKTISLLRNTLNTFTDFLPENPADDLTVYLQNFENYVKTLNLLYGVGEGDVKNTYKELYHTIQTAFHEAIGQDDNNIESPLLYVFYAENFALLDPEVRKKLSENYKIGGASFAQDAQKAEKYSKPLNLLLSPKLFHS